MSNKITSIHHHGRTEIEVHGFRNARGMGDNHKLDGIELIVDHTPTEGNGRRKFSTVILSPEAAKEIHRLIGLVLGDLS